MENKHNFLALAQLIDFNSTEIDKSLRAIFEKGVAITRDMHTYLIVGNYVCIGIEFNFFENQCIIHAMEYFPNGEASQKQAFEKLFSFESMPTKALAFDKLQSKLNSFLEIGEKFDWKSDKDIFLKELNEFVNKA